MNRGQEQRLEEVIGKRDNIESFSAKELFRLTLCFSGKIKRDNVLEIYGNIIEEYSLDMERLQELVKLLKQ